MANYPSITGRDIERYNQFRALSRRFSDALAETIPREAIVEMGGALGIMHNGTILLDTMDVSAVLMDSCLFDWVRDGKNLFEKYAETQPFAPGTDEHSLLQAYCRARYRILVPEALKPGAAVYCLDTLSSERLVLMDIGLSQSIGRGVRVVVATRTVPLGGYWVTTGASLPVGDKRTGEKVLKKIEQGNLLEDRSPTGEHKLATAVIRTLLDCGAAEHIRYQGVNDDEEDGEVDIFGPEPEVRSPRHTGRNEPCPCGSGKKYKRCCLGK